MSTQGQTPSDILSKAKIAYSQGLYPQAMVMYRQLLTDQQLESEGLKGLGFCLQATGSHVEAADMFHSAISRFPNDPDLAFGHGLALQSLGRHSEAITAFDFALKQSPNHTAAKQHRDASNQALTSAQSNAANQAASAIPAMLPCPKCKQPMLGRSRLCPHCGVMVDPIAGQILSGRAELIADTPAEKVYKVISWLRICFGALYIIVGILIPIPFVGVLLSIIGSWFLFTGIGLLMEVGWVQFITYWGSLLAALGNCMSLFNAFTIGNYAGVPFDLIALTVHGLTMWSISKLSDYGA